MGDIEDIESQNKKINSATRTLAEFLKIAKSASWKAIDSDLSKAKAVYADLKVEMIALATALPEVT